MAIPEQTFGANPFPFSDKDAWEKIAITELKGKAVSFLSHETEPGIVLESFYDSLAWKGRDFLTNQAPGEFPFLRGHSDSGKWETILSVIPEIDSVPLIHGLSDQSADMVFRIEVPGNVNSNKLKDFFLALPENRHYQLFAGRASLEMLAILRSVRPGLNVQLASDPFDGFFVKGWSPLEWNMSAAAFFAQQGAGDEFRFCSFDASEAALCGIPDSMQIAVLLSKATECIEQLSQFGISPEDVLRHSIFSLPAGTRFFPSIAKFRVFRQLFSALLESYSAGPECGKSLRLEAEIFSYNLNKADTHSNLLRLTTACMSAILGAVDAVHIPAFRDSLSPGFPLRMSRNISLLLKHESGLDAVTDPAGGSWYLEELTAQMAESAWNYFLEIEKAGGIIPFHQSGGFKAPAESNRIPREEGIRNRETIIVGLNHYPAGEDEFLVPALDKQQKAESLNLASFRFQSMDSPEHIWKSLLEVSGKLVIEEPGNKNFPEICAEPLPQIHARKDFETIRLNAEKIYSRSKRPLAVLFVFGDPVMRTARSNFSQNVLGLAGIKCIESPSELNTEDSVNWVQERNPEVIVFCASDEDYSQVPGLIQRIVEKGNSPCFILAGKPSMSDTYRAAGVHAFIFRKMNAPEFLQELLHLILNEGGES